MPNWCGNIVTVSGENVLQFVADMRYACAPLLNSNFSFTLVSPGDWGTKWDACHSSPPTVEGEKVVYRFDTPNDPPTIVMNALQEKYPELNFELLYSFEGDENEDSFLYVPRRSKKLFFHSYFKLGNSTHNLTWSVDDIYEKHEPGSLTRVLLDSYLQLLDETSSH